MSRRIGGRRGTSRGESIGWIAGAVLTLAIGVSGLAREASADGPREPQPLGIPGVSTTSDAAAESGDGIDALLKLPSGYLEPTGRTVAGAGEEEWRRRFERAHKKLDRAVDELAQTKQELDAVAGTGGSSQWSVAPPGASSSGGPTGSPLSFKLRQDLLRNREQLDEAEKALKALRIEADLAGVPVGWRGDENRTIPRRIPEDPR